MMHFTVLTESLDLKGKVKEDIKKVIGKHKRYGGHYAVTRSLIEGLKKIGYPGFNYRPHNKGEIHEIVHVLSGVDALRYAIELKREGVIKFLSAGPNIHIYLPNYDNLVNMDDIDLFLQPCGWASDYFVTLYPNFANRCESWAAGVDLKKYWPEEKRRKHRKNALIYYKVHNEYLLHRVKFKLKSYGFHTEIIEYRKYSMKQYLALLKKVDFMVCLTRTETQGLFLAEAWAMDVPTICFDSNYFRCECKGKVFEFEGNTSHCPYLSEYTGVRFYEISDLDHILSNWPEIREKMKPRRWVEKNMTDEICARNFVSILENAVKL